MCVCMCAWHLYACAYVSHYLPANSSRTCRSKSILQTVSVCVCMRICMCMCMCAWHLYVCTYISHYLPANSSRTCRSKSRLQTVMRLNLLTPLPLAFPLGAVKQVRKTEAMWLQAVKWAASLSSSGTKNKHRKVVWR